MRASLVLACLILALLPAAASPQGGDAIDAPRITQQAFKKLLAANNVIVGDTWIPAVQNAEVKAFLGQALVTFRVHEEHAGHMVAALR